MLNDQTIHSIQSEETRSIGALCAGKYRGQIRGEQCSDALGISLRDRCIERTRRKTAVAGLLRKNNVVQRLAGSGQNQRGRADVGNRFFTILAELSQLRRIGENATGFSPEPRVESAEISARTPSRF